MIVSYGENIRNDIQDALDRNHLRDCKLLRECPWRSPKSGSGTTEVVIVQ